MNEKPVRPVVLVVDDTPEYLSILGEILQATYAVRIANSGALALELAARTPHPDLVLLDIMMPAMDGLEVFSRLRANPATHDIPVVFISGLDTSDDERQGLMLGAADYITKPFVASVVLARVGTQIELKLARDGHNAANAELRVQKSALEKTVTDLETFSYSLSHDLRSPLSTINGFAALLERTEGERLTDQGRQRLGRILEGTQVMDRTIDDILACMHVERATLNIAWIHLDETVKDALTVLRDAYPATDVICSDLPSVEADPVMVRQILTNLLGNAFKFSSRKEHPQIKVGYRAAGLTKSGAAELFVKDNGAGFDPKAASGLFTLFHRLHSQSDFKGSGVGLAIARRMVERHGGWIHAESRPGEGAEFTFTLWAAEAAPQ